MSEEKMEETNKPIKRAADDFDDFKLFLKKKKIQNEVLKKLIKNPVVESANKKK